MPRDLRPRLPGAPVFFTVALAQRGSGLLVEEVNGRERPAAAESGGNEVRMMLSSSKGEPI